MDKDLFRIGANCTDVDCKNNIPNSDCFAGLCKCKAGFGPSLDQRKCKKSKKFGSSCHPITDTCFMEKLYCDQNMICQCAPGYRYDHSKNDCIWFYYCDDNLIWDTTRRSCIKPNEFWFPTTNYNPKLSFITFILLVFCFLKLMRSNRRRISSNANRSFDFLSIMNYENNQRYPMRTSSETNRHSSSRNHHHSRRGGDEENQEAFFAENQAPPAYEEIMSDLKAVTVINNNIDPVNDPNNYLNSQEDNELKDMNPVRKLSQPNDQIVNANSQPNNLNDLYASTNHIESQSTSSEQSASSDGHQQRQDIVNNNNRNLANVDLHNDTSSETARLPSDQLNTSSSEDQLPTYQQAISKMPPV